MMLKMAVLMMRHSGGEVTVPRPGGSGICGQKQRESAHRTRDVLSRIRFTQALNAGDAEKLSDSRRSCWVEVH